MDTIFYNADYIVIEYIDIIKSPYLMLLDQIRRNSKLKQILNIEEIEFLSAEGLYEWYINRKHRNFFMDLNLYPDKIPKEYLDELLEDQLKITSCMYDLAVPLNIVHSLPLMKAKKITNDVIIYHPHKNNFAKKDLEAITGTTFTFMDDFDKILDLAGANSTYFLSDIENVKKMKDRDLLKFSSITLPLEYRYNKKNMTEYKYDLVEWYKKYPYKLSFIRACTFETKKEET